jgi:hypothetical protein
MVSVAVAALLAATGFASAQGVGTKGSESPAAASPKADSAAPMNAPAAKGAETAAPGAASKEAMPQHAQGKPDAKTTGEMKAGSKSTASDSAAPAATSKDTKNPTAETKPTADSKTKASDSSTPATTLKDIKNPTAETKPTADSKTKASDSTTPATTSKDIKNPTAETKPTADSKTTGNAATSATAAPPAEKQTQIVSAIKQEKVEEVTNVNFNISIGTAVPSITIARTIDQKRSACATPIIIANNMAMVTAGTRIKTLYRRPRVTPARTLIIANSSAIAPTCTQGWAPPNFQIRNHEDCPCPILALC